MILIGFPEAAVDEKVLEEVRKGKAGSIIIFEKNIPKTNSFIALKKIIWTYQKAAPIPLFITIDQEGGKVNRLKDKYGFPRSITAAAMGRAHSPDSVRFYGEATAATLKGLGINVNFAPVVDLASNPNNPVIAKNERAFSANEDSVTLLAREWIDAHRKMGVITVLKHFPGHGSSKDDTHLGMADVTNTWEERELVPYRKLINAGEADGVMSAHIVNRKLDPEGNPGTLSFPILTGILRNQLHYDGVIFSDDMQMHAITEHYGLEEAIKRAINAGIDVMTFSNNIVSSELRTVDKVHEIVKHLVATGQISRERINQSYKRIMELKKRFIIYPGKDVEEKARPSEQELIACKDSLQVKNAELEKAEQENKLLREQLAQKDSKKKKKKK